MVIQQQVQQANDSGDTSVIDANFLLQTKETLEVLLQRMSDLYGEQNLLSRADYEQAEQMLSEINAVISWVSLAMFLTYELLKYAIQIYNSIWKVKSRLLDHYNEFE